ncbi:MAG TPA: POTRA domain-containing protein, partial [Thermomonas sp.]|nr:POTRA domain-containing protein [Thermomonas sp.]
MDTQNMHRNLLTAALLLACMPLAQAAEGSEAGPQQTAVSTPQQAQALAEPQMAAQTQASFVLQGVEFAGATGVPESELQAAAAGMIGQNVTFQDLERIAAKATDVYRKHGLALVQVFV